MEVQKGQIDSYKSQGFEFKRRSKKLLGGQSWTVATYEKHYPIKEKPQLVYSMLKHSLNRKKWPEAGEDLRAIFTGKKLIKVKTQEGPRVPLDGGIRKLIDKDVVKPVNWLKMYANKAAGKPEDKLTQEEVVMLGDMGREKLTKLHEFLDNTLQPVFKSQFEDKWDSHTNKQWDSYESDTVRVSYTPIKEKTSGKEEKITPKYTIEVNGKEKENSIVLAGEEYEMSADLLKKILNGYFHHRLSHMDNDKFAEYTQFLVHNDAVKSMDNLFSFELKEF